MHIVLYQPEIPANTGNVVRLANTGNVVRLCAVTGCHLHLIRPLGFSTDDRQLKRAGLDYWHLLKIDYWDDIHELFEAYKVNPKYFLTSKAAKGYTEVHYDPDSLLVFGRETLNLSNAVAVVTYEAFRQQPDFGGLSLTPTFHSGKLNSQYEL